MRRAGGMGYLKKDVFDAGVVCGGGVGRDGRVYVVVRLFGHADSGDHRYNGDAVPELPAVGQVVVYGLYDRVDCFSRVPVVGADDFDLHKAFLPIIKGHRCLLAPMTLLYHTILFMSIFEFE